MLTATTTEVMRPVRDYVAEVLAKAGIEGPSVNPVKVAKALGFEMVTSDRLDRRAGTQRDLKLIVVRKEPNPRRQAFAAAHELGEQIAERIVEWLGDPAGVWNQEHLATAFAFELLAPTKWLRRACRDEEYDLAAIAGIFTTASHEVLAKRFLTITDTPTIVSIWDNGKLTSRECNQGEWETPKLTKAEKASRDLVHQSARADRRKAQEGNALIKIQTWPVNTEEGSNGLVWRREIQRTTIEETWE